MRTPIVVVVAAGLALGLVPGLGCSGKKQGSAKDGAKAEPQSRTAICAELATQSARAAEMAAAGLASGLGDGKGLTDEDRAQLRAELDVGVSDFEQKCREWPEEVFECIRRRDQGEACQKAVASAMGDAPPPDAPAGPKPTWSAKLPDRPRRVILGDGGLVVALLEDQLVAWQGGAQVWARALEGADELRLDADGTLWVMSYEPFVRALDPATGKDRYQLAVPTAPKGEDGEVPRGGVRVWAEAPGGEIVLATSDARFFARPPGCKATKCLRALGRLEDEELDGDAELAVGPDGSFYLHEFGLVRGFDPKLAPIFRVHGHDFFAGIVAAPGRVVVTSVGSEMISFAADLCRSDKPLVLASPSGKLGEAEDDCEDCEPPPPGCVIAKRKLPEPDYVEPVLAHGGERVLQVTDECLTALAVPGLVPAWTLKMPAGGRPVAPVGPIASGDLALVICFVEGDAEGEDATDTPLALCGVDAATGTLKWRTPLGFNAGLIYGVDDLWLGRRGDQVVVGYREHVAVLALPGPTATPAAPASPGPAAPAAPAP